MFICLMSLSVLSNIITCFIRVLDARFGPTEGPPCVLFLNAPYTGLIKRGFLHASESICSVVIRVGVSRQDVCNSWFTIVMHDKPFG